MQRAEETITINAPPKIVFDFVNDPKSIQKIWPSIAEVSDEQRLLNGGMRFRLMYKMAGMRFTVVSEDVEYVPHSRVVNKTTGGIESTMIWTYLPEDGGTKTKLTLKVEYDAPIPLLGRLAELVVAKINKDEIAVMLVYLKAQTERLAGFTGR